MTSPVLDVDVFRPGLIIKAIREHAPGQPIFVLLHPDGSEAHWLRRSANMYEQVMPYD